MGLLFHAEAACFRQEAGSDTGPEVSNRSIEARELGGFCRSSKFRQWNVVFQWPKLAYTWSTSHIQSRIVFGVIAMSNSEMIFQRPLISGLRSTVGSGSSPQMMVTSSCKSEKNPCSFDVHIYIYIYIIIYMYKCIIHIYIYMYKCIIYTYV